MARVFPVGLRRGEKLVHVTINLPARGPGLPASIPFRADTPVGCVIQRDAGDPPVPVQFEVVGGSAEAGVATLIGGAKLMATGQVVLRGDAQTAPLAEGQAAPLRLRAIFNGQECGSSQGFSVCSHPSAVHNGPECLPHVGYDGGTVRVGMYIEIRVESD